MGEACFNANSRIEEHPIAELSDLPWYAVQTGYRCEQKVAQALTAKGYYTYLPLLRETRQWKDRRKTIDMPAFTGYLFVRYEPSLRNRVRVLETSGIVRLLGGNHAPSQISEMEIEAVRRTLDSGVVCHRFDALTPGAKVRVIRGPLTGVQGRLVRFKNSLRLVIAISVFSQGISAELGLSDVEAIHDRSGAQLTDWEYSAAG
jgi:transcription antitermination factor NusG